jgi:hypothetical protein
LYENSGYVSYGYKEISINRKYEKLPDFFFDTLLLYRFKGQYSTRFAPALAFALVLFGHWLYIFMFFMPASHGQVAGRFSGRLV